MVRADRDQPADGRAVGARRPRHPGHQHPRLPHLTGPDARSSRVRGSALAARADGARHGAGGRGRTGAGSSRRATAGRDPSRWSGDRAPADCGTRSGTIRRRGRLRAPGAWARSRSRRPDVRQIYGGPQTATSRRWAGVRRPGSPVDGCRSRSGTPGPCCPAGRGRPVRGGLPPGSVAAVRSTRSIAVHSPAPWPGRWSSRWRAAGTAGERALADQAVQHGGVLAADPPAAACRSRARESSVVRPAARE